MSRLNSAIDKVAQALDEYKLDEAFREIMDFVVKDFSRGYIKMTRDRDDTKEILKEVLEKISLILAPFAPYISEFVYSNFSKDSVHLSEWPKADKKKIDLELEEEFETAFKIIENGLRERDRNQIGLKWPLPKATIKYNKPLKKEFFGIIKSELNIKEIEYIIKKTEDVIIKLNTKLTPELEAEGYAREISRKVQAFRKKLGLNKNDEIGLQLIVDDKFKNILKMKEGFIKERTNSSKLLIVTTSKERFKNNIEFKIKDKKGVIGIKTL